MTNQDLIRQYVDTGISIPEYQYNKLSNNLKRTYERKRLIYFKESGELPNYWEMGFVPQEFKNQLRNEKPTIEEFLHNYIGAHIVLLSPDEQIKYMESQLDKKYFFDDFSKVFSKMAPEVKAKFIKNKIAVEEPLTDEEFDSIEELESMEVLTYPPNFKKHYLEESSRRMFYFSKYRITKKQFDSMTDIQKLNFSMLKDKFSGGYSMLQPYQYEKLSHSSKKKYDVFFLEKFEDKILGLKKNAIPRPTDQEYDWILKNPYYGYWIFDNHYSETDRNYSNYFYEKYYPFKD